MRDFKRIAAVVVSGFFIFAPPGTLIVIALFVFGLTGKIGVIVGGCLAACALAWLILRRRVNEQSESTMNPGALLRSAPFGVRRLGAASLSQSDHQRDTKAAPSRRTPSTASARQASAWRSQVRHRML